MPPPIDEEPDMTHRPFRLNPVRLVGAGLWLAAAVVAAHAMAAARDGAVDETARTAAAVMAVDQHWSDAETDGDTAWLEQMLLPEYRSVNNKGVATPKAGIVAHAAKSRGLGKDKQKQMVEAWRKAHPSESKVVLHGDTAIITFYDPARARSLAYVPWTSSSTKAAAGMRCTRSTADSEAADPRSGASHAHHQLAEVASLQ